MLRTPARLNGTLGRMKKAGGSVVVRSSVAVLLIASAVTWCVMTEQPSRYLTKYEESLHDGFWVPRYFPNDIEEIYEAHDIDTNRTWVRFALGRIAYSPTTHGYSPVEVSLDPPMHVQAPRLANWWFTSLEETNGTAGELYKGPCRPTDPMNDMKGYVLIKKPLVYWWCQWE